MSDTIISVYLIGQLPFCLIPDFFFVTSWCVCFWQIFQLSVSVNVGFGGMKWCFI